MLTRVLAGLVWAPPATLGGGTASVCCSSPEEVSRGQPQRHVTKVNWTVSGLKGELGAPARAPGTEPKVSLLWEHGMLVSKSARLWQEFSW